MSVTWPLIVTDTFYVTSHHYQMYFSIISEKKVETYFEFALSYIQTTKCCIPFVIILTKSKKKLYMDESMKDICHECSACPRLVSDLTFRSLSANSDFHKKKSSASNFEESAHSSNNDNGGNCTIT